MKQWSLLDDSEEAIVPEKTWEEIANVVRKENFKQLTSLKNTIQATSVAAHAAVALKQQATKKEQQGTVFSSRPTLRDLMQEYNNRSALTSKLIKPSNEANSKNRTSVPFRSDRIAHYEIPGLTARILRPAK